MHAAVAIWRFSRYFIKCTKIITITKIIQKDCLLILAKKILSLVLVIIALAHDLLASWSEEYRVLVLCCVTALDVTQRRIGVHNSTLAKVVQSHQVLSLTKSI